MRTSAPVKILLIGAGAVGQVFALHLRDGGASIGFQLKPTRVGAAHRELPLYRHTLGRRHLARLVLRDFEVRVDGEASAGDRWDQVWLCTSSQDLRSPWVDELAATSDDATVVAIQPDLEDRAHLVARFGEERLVQGLIGFLSYQAPLPEQPEEGMTPPGVAYWLPPGMATLFHGTPHRVGAVEDALRRGAFPARVRDGVPDTSALRSATTVPVVAGLELAGWSLAELGAGPELERALAASRQALEVVDAVRGTRSAARRWVLRPALARAALGVARGVTPFPLEAYLRFHFTKTAPQTRFLLDTWVARGAERGIDTDPIAALRAALPARGEP